MKSQKSKTLHLFTKDITMYTTVYLAKKQGRNYNVSAILAKGYEYHLNHLQDLNTLHVDNIRDLRRLLLFRLVNAINQEQELAELRWLFHILWVGKTHCSHHYTPIYWPSSVSATAQVIS